MRIMISTEAFALLQPAEPRAFARSLGYVRMWPGKYGSAYGNHWEARDGSRLFIGTNGLVRYVAKRTTGHIVPDRTTAEDIFAMLEVADDATRTTLSIAIDAIDPVHRDFFAAA